MKDMTDIVIPCFGRPKETFLTVEALLKANDDIRVILVHDGGMDKPNLSALDTNRIIQLDLPHGGQPKALNTAFKLVESEYTIIMHNDVIISDKGWVRKAVNFLKTHKDAGLVCASGTIQVWDNQMSKHVHLISSISRNKGNDREFVKRFNVVRPKEDFTETWRTDSMVNVFKTGIKADERYGSDMIVGISFWIDVLAKKLKCYVMKFDDAIHIIDNPVRGLEAYKKIADISTEVKKQGKFVQLRLQELGVKYPPKGYYKDEH